MCVYPKERLFNYYPHGKLELFRISTVVDQIKELDFSDADYPGLCIVVKTLVDHSLA